MDIAAVLNRHAGTAARFCVAYSGGLDSTVLLHALQDIYGAGRVRALHVDHGLQPGSRVWAEHCCRGAARLGITCTVLDVRVPENAGLSLEAAARDARYAAFAAALQPDEFLVTAHHAQDQLETVLLALLRGAGVHGLAAMPEFGAMRGCRIIRPLLTVSRTTLAERAVAAGLDWVEDPSNRDERFDRNYLRHQVLPLLEARWPAAARAAHRSARLSAAAAAVLDEVAAVDLADGLQGNCLSLAVLRATGPARRANLLRFVCRCLRLPLPSENQLHTALAMLLDAREDAQPLVAWPGVRIRRYREQAWWYPQSADPGDCGELPDRLDWDAGGPLEMGPVRGCLRWIGAGPDTPRGAALAGRLRVRFRTGGERLRPAPGAATRDLKKLLQEAGVVPWMRKHIPLLYLDGELFAVADLWSNADHPAWRRGAGPCVKWSGHMPLRAPD